MLTCIFLNFLRDNNVHFFTAEKEDIKAAKVERFNRTLNDKMWRFFLPELILCGRIVLDDLIRNYNCSYNRRIKMAHVQVSVKNQDQIRLVL